MAGSIANRWEEIQGRDKWSELLEPLDIDLRQSILNYGDLNQAIGDAFNMEKASENFATSRYARAHFFDRVGLVIENPYRYRVTKFFYAPSDLNQPAQLPNRGSSWMGYVAVATDEGKVALGRRDIAIAWRGTILSSEVIKDLNFALVSASEILGDASNGGGATDPKVHAGFLSIYTSANPNFLDTKTSARDQVISEVTRLVEEYKDEEISITVTGHSMGGAIATLNAADIAAHRINKLPNKPCPVTAIVFASPRVGDSDFKLAFSAMEDLRLLRVRNAPDIIPDLPPSLPPLIPYVDIGVELSINTRISNFLKADPDNKFPHQLEIYLHGVAGTQGNEGGFQLEVKRDIALVNKWLDALKDEYLVPTTWWIEKNKGMVQSNDGSWHFDDREEDNGDV